MDKASLVRVNFHIRHLHPVDIQAWVLCQVSSCVFQDWVPWSPAVWLRTESWGPQFCGSTKSHGLHLCSSRLSPMVPSSVTQDWVLWSPAVWLRRTESLLYFLLPCCNRPAQMRICSLMAWVLLVELHTSQGSWEGMTAIACTECLMLRINSSNLTILWGVTICPTLYMRETRPREIKSAQNNGTKISNPSPETQTYTDYC